MNREIIALIQLTESAVELTGVIPDNLFADFIRANGAVKNYLTAVELGWVVLPETEATKD